MQCVWPRVNPQHHIKRAFQVLLRHIPRSRSTLPTQPLVSDNTNYYLKISAELYLQFETSSDPPSNLILLFCLPLCCPYLSSLKQDSDTDISALLTTAEARPKQHSH